MSALPARPNPMIGDGTAEIGHGAPLRVRRAAGTAGWMLGIGADFGSPRSWNAGVVPDGRPLQTDVSGNRFGPRICPDRAHLRF
jgi:hypothetical protein